MITPFDVDFGTVQTGCRAFQMPFTIRNICTTPQTVSAVGVSGAGFSTSTLALPQALAAQGTVNVTVTFAPTVAGPVSGTLVVGASSGGATVAYQVPVRGTGAATGANQERFTIPTKTDVVLIVDNSCSMSTHQANLGGNVNAFLAYALSANVDFNLGVTTTDFDSGGERGAFVGATNKVLRSTTPNLLQVLNARVNVGVNGSGIEMMFEPAVAAVTQPLITTTNRDFLRTDAALAILAFTDAVEQSPRPASDYYQQLLRVKGFRRRNELSVSFVGPTRQVAPGTCSYDGTPTPDPREVQMIAQSGGTSSEICSVGNTQAWRAEASRLGQVVFGARAVWFLTGKPSPAVAGSVAVTVNGLPIAEMGAAGRNWSYDAVRNAVVFEPVALPAPGQTVGFDYAVACMP